MNKLLPAATFCYVWLMVGFFSGTLVLIGPAGWLTSAIRARGWPQHSENVAMIALIVAYVIASALVALWLFRLMGRCKTSRSRYGIPTALTLAAGLCVWAWMNPARLMGAAHGMAGSVRLAGGPEFVLGPYPVETQLAELKRDGFTAVISLQHPAVVPIEPPDIAAEDAAAQKVGIPIIHDPMLPWISSNEAALEKIREIAKRGRGRYYVHCGLGRDRVNIVKRMLELEGDRVAAGEGYTGPESFAQAVADGEPWMARGLIKELEKDVWLIPYPDKNDYNYLLAGQVNNVMLLLDPNDAEQHSWIEEARQILSKYKIPFTLKPASTDPRQLADVIETIRTLQRPVAVIAPYTRPQPRAQVANALVQAYDHQKP